MWVVFMWGPESVDDRRLGQKSLLVVCLILGCGFSGDAELVSACLRPTVWMEPPMNADGR